MILNYKELGFKLVKSGSLFDRYLDFKGYHGYITAWGQVYIKEDYKSNQMLLKHEWRHVQQMTEDGVIIWNLKYIAYQIIYGYWNNPYEIDARKFAGDTRLFR